MNSLDIDSINSIKKEKQQLRDRAYYQANKVKHNQRSKSYYQANKEAIQARRRAFRENNIDAINAQRRQRLQEDHETRFRCNLQRRIRRSLTSVHSQRYAELIGCSHNFLQLFFAFLFTKIDPQMSFDNHGTYWHIDHVRPVASFDLSKDDEVKLCFHWTNLSPLEAKLNISKSCKVDHEVIAAHARLVNEFKAWCVLHNVDETTLDTAALQQCFAQQQA